MKIRTGEMLSDRLSQDLAWRKKELADLSYYLKTTGESGTRKNVLARCGIAILYAHWEGYIKNSGRNYLEFVTMQRLSLSELKENLITLVLQNKISSVIETQKPSQLGFVTSFFLDELDKRALLPYKSAINTESNLSSKVFKEIIWCLGLDYGPFETKEKLIDSKLLGKRNHIAHGKDLEVDLDEFNQLHQEVINMMDVFKNQLENSSTMKAFKKNQSELTR